MRPTFKQLNRSVVCSYLLMFGSVALAKPLLPLAAYEGFKVFTDVTAFTYTENMPIDAFFNDFEGDFPSKGKFELTHNEVSAGIGYQGVELEFFKRMDYYFRTNRDTFNLIYMDQNKIDFPIGQVFDVFLHVQQVEGDGLRLGYRFAPADNLEIYLGGSYFESNDALYGSLEGKIWQDESRPRGDLVVDYIYTKEYILKRPLTPPGSGYGYGYDIAINWKPVANVTVNAIFDDVAARINWKHAPHTEAVMVSDRNRIDENGKPYKVPTLSGKHGFVERTQVLPVHRVLAVSYSFTQPYTVTLEQETYDKVDFTRILAGYSVNRWFKVEVGHDFKSDADSIEFWSPYASLLLATDSINEKQAKNSRAELSLHYGF